MKKGLIFVLWFTSLFVAINLVIFDLLSPGYILKTRIQHNCRNQGQTSCSQLKLLPPTWSEKTININGEDVSCGDILKCDSCEGCGFV